MNRRIKAKKQVNTMLHHHFKYLFVENAIDLNTIHLTFQMDSKSHNLQMTLRFTDKYCDVLCFISPRVLNEKYENFDVLKTINTINWYIKSSGRFYIDDYNDIVYSLRLGYDILETMPDMFLAELETSIQYYEDLFVLILEVSSGKKTYCECKEFIDEMWGVLE